MLDVETIPYAGDQPIAAGPEGDLRSLHMDPPVVVAESVIHPVLAAVDGVILEPDVGAALHVDQRPVPAMVEAEDEAVTRGDVGEVVCHQVDAQQATGPIHLGNVLDEVDRSRLDPACLRLDRESDPGPRLPFELLTKFDRVGVAFVDFP